MSVSDKPLFRDLTHALQWAYGSPGDTVRVSEVSRRAVRTRRAIEQSEADSPDDGNVVHVLEPDLDREPHGFDAAGQAGLIQSSVRALPVWERSHIQAKFSFGLERRNAQVMLTGFVLPTLEMVVRNRRIVYALVKRYYWRKSRQKPIPFFRMAEQFSTPIKRVRAYWRATGAALQVIEYRAETMLWARLRAQGVVR